MWHRSRAESEHYEAELFDMLDGIGRRGEPKYCQDLAAGDPLVRLSKETWAGPRKYRTLETRPG